MFVAALDQGTTSTRCMIFDAQAQVVASAQLEHAQLFPEPGWVEHDALEIWRNTQTVIAQALAQAGLVASDVQALGITNQRETTVMWDVRTGEPIAPAVVWQDLRTRELCGELAGEVGPDRYRQRVGLPLATYFSGPKMRWLLDALPGARELAQAGHLRAGTIDSWLIWNLTGGAGSESARHVTDVTNASRTMLMDLRTLAWDEDICADFQVPVGILGEIVPSIGRVAQCGPDSPLPGVWIAGVLGDQHAATMGQACFEPGMVKNTYGTGAFLIMNTGNDVVFSDRGLLTTVAYQYAGQPAVYALEGSVAVAGSAVQWLRDNLGLISQAAQIEELATSVQDTGGTVFVPAFSGLFAPHWRPDARGVWVGMTRYVTKAHLARAVLESVAHQSREVVAAMQADSQIELTQLRVDGGMVLNNFLMQCQADLLGVPVVRPKVHETTALGAAYAAGLATGVWSDEPELVQLWQEDHRWQPELPQEKVRESIALWEKGIQRSLDWA